jgi:hypothetical protein
MELLVVMLLMGVISGVLIALAVNSSALISQGASVIELNQKARSAVSRMAPYVATAVGSATGSPLITPKEKLDAPTADDLISYQTLRFNTTEDFLRPASDPLGAYNPASPWNPSSGTFVYEFAFDNTGGQAYKLETGATINLGRIVLRKVIAGTPVDNPPPRVIAHNVQLFRCYAIGSYAVEVVVNTVGKRKHSQGNLVDVFEEQDAVLSIPTGSIKI